MTFFGKTLEQLVASCTNNEYIDHDSGVYVLYDEERTKCCDYDGDKNWGPVIAAINRNRTLFQRDFSTILKGCLLPPYRMCDPVPCLRDFKRKTQSTASLVDTVIQFYSFTTGYDVRVVIPAWFNGAAAFVELFNALDVTEETDAAVMLFTFTLQKVMHVCDLSDPWGQLMKWRAHCNVKLEKLSAQWLRVETKRRVEILQLPNIIPQILIDNFNAGTPVPFEKFYSPEEVLKMMQTYYGTPKFDALGALFKDGLLSRTAVLP